MRYTIEARDAADNVLEVLGRESLATPATAAYRAYIEYHPGRIITLREGGRLMLQSDRND